MRGMLQTMCLFGIIINPAIGDDRVTHLYDKYGNNRGDIRQEGSRAVTHDQNGNERGYSRQEGDRTVYYDNNGNRKGYTKP